MSDKLDRLAAESEAARVLEDHTFESLPICPLVIAENVGIVVQPKESSDRGVSGFLMRVGETFGIQYATHIPSQGFIRFTVAHELGHYFLPGHADHLFPSGKGLHYSRSGFFGGDRFERQADYFASALLMPEQRFRQEMRTAGQGLRAIKKLAERFHTSLSATAIRYAGFTDDAVAVIVSTGRTVDYCVMSARIRDLPGLTWIRKQELIPQSSTTGCFNMNPVNVETGVSEEGTCFLDDWFDGAPNIEMYEDVLGLGSYGKTLTVLFTESDLEEDEQNEDFD
jgi:Zn-dependent peptidase ImmA (M78 family)